jgi:uncharacterized protein involved in exopolysaccharide biosynthesis
MGPEWKRVMIENRELTMDDYLAMLRRRAKVIVFPMLLLLPLGFLISYAVPAKYTSQSLILVEGQKVPEAMVQPVVSDDLQTRIQMLKAVATSDSEMHPVLASLFPNRSSQQIDAMLDDMRNQPDLIGVPFSDLSQITGSNVKKKPGQATSPGFFVSYTAPNAREAQQVCEALTSKIIAKNLQFIQDNAKGTVDVLSQGLENAKNNLDAMDAKMAGFKKQYSGQLPGDEENNLKLLATLSTQLEANTQNLNRAQQDKAYTESLLAQQLAAWKSSQSSTNPQTLEKQLSDLQSELLQLQARYTGDHPDVIKTKADIAGVKAKLAEVNKSTGEASEAGIGKSSAGEPLEIRQMRIQVHQYENAITAATREQKRLQPEISALQGRVSLSPAVEQQYEQLTRDYSTAKKTYEDLLADKSKADLTANMTSQAQGERMDEIQPASLPDSPSFPNRLIFAAGGLAAGLTLGGGIALWLELRDNSIRTEADAEAAMQLPLLVSVPWVGFAAEEEKKGKFWQRKKKPDAQKETVSV